MVVVAIAIALDAVALVVVSYFWHRTRNWRFGPMALLFLLLAVQHSLTFADAYWAPRVSAPLNFFIDFAVTLVSCGGAAGFLIGFRDQRNLRQRLIERENQLRHAQKMGMVGRVAGGIAHDINNMLTAVFGNLEVAQMRLRNGRDMGVLLDEIQLAADRCATLVRRLLAFSRRAPSTLGPVDLNEVLLELHPMVRRVVGEGIELVVLPAPLLGEVHADPRELEQVILNLAANARDAMPQGGRLVLETMNAVEPSGSGPTSQVVLHVSDTGMGMKPEVMERVFEPFFTTKAEGKGTGLGLATAHAMIQQAGGRLDVESELGQGARFSIRLPRCEANQPHEETVGNRVSPDGHESVLVVEDEPLVRQSVHAVLESHGYRVSSVASGSEALRLMHLGYRSFDLVITDRIMPLMSGDELAMEISVNYPRVRVLMMSGYGAAAHPSRATMVDLPALDKPFTAACLTQRVRDVLDQPPAHRLRLVHF